MCQKRCGRVTTAVANMIIMIFGYAFHSLIGSVVNAMGGPQISQALLRSVHHPAALCIGTAGFLILFVKEKKSNRHDGAASTCSCGRVKFSEDERLGNDKGAHL